MGHRLGYLWSCTMLSLLPKGSFSLERPGAEPWVGGEPLSLGCCFCTEHGFTVNTCWDTHKRKWLKCVIRLCWAILIPRGIVTSWTRVGSFFPASVSLTVAQSAEIQQKAFLGLKLRWQGSLSFWCIPVEGTRTMTEKGGDPILSLWWRKKRATDTEWPEYFSPGIWWLSSWYEQ